MKFNLLVLLWVCSFRVSSYFDFKRFLLDVVLRRKWMVGKGGSGDQLEAITRPARDDGLDQGERWEWCWEEEGFGYILKIEPMGFSDKLDVRERRLQLRVWKDGTAVTWDRKTRWSGWGRKLGAWCLALNLRCLFDIPHGVVFGPESELSVIQPLVVLGSVPDISLLNLYPLLNLSLPLLELIYQLLKFWLM